MNENFPHTTPSSSSSLSLIVYLAKERAGVVDTLAVELLILFQRRDVRLGALGRVQ